MAAVFVMCTALTTVVATIFVSLCDPKHCNGHRLRNVHDPKHCCGHRLRSMHGPEHCCGDSLISFRGSEQCCGRRVRKFARPWALSCSYMCFKLDINGVGTFLLKCSVSEVSAGASCLLGPALVRNAGRAAQRHFRSSQLRRRGRGVHI